ncbi:MAG: hypothetical protein HOB92_02485 [Candidatus Cloacimonetes bacterium]|nr:hypothetical protein [Candidatus Cloacimonadota bacterium]
MAIIKIHKKTRFVVVDNKLARNKHLTLKAKGLMLYLLSLPSDKNITVKELEKHTIEGLDALHNAVSELVSEGYINKRTYRNEKGLFQTEYTVYEYPQETIQTGLTDTDKPDRTNRTGSSEPENPILRSKESIKKKEEKKESDLISSSSDINREMQLLGIGEEEIERILEKIDDDDKLKLLKEKINLIKHLVTTGTIKNTAAYAIKVIKSTNFNQIELRKAEKRKKSILSAEKRKRDVELMKKERKEWNDDIERRKEETGDISEVVSDFTEKMDLNKKIGGANV